MSLLRCCLTIAMKRYLSIQVQLFSQYCILLWPQLNFFNNPNIWKIPHSSFCTRLYTLQEWVWDHKPYKPTCRPVLHSYKVKVNSHSKKLPVLIVNKNTQPFVGILYAYIYFTKKFNVSSFNWFQKLQVPDRCHIVS